MINCVVQLVNTEYLPLNHKRLPVNHINILEMSFAMKIPPISDVILVIFIR